LWGREVAAYGAKNMFHMRMVTMVIGNWKLPIQLCATIVNIINSLIAFWFAEYFSIHYAAGIQEVCNIFIDSVMFVISVFCFQSVNVLYIHS